MFAPHSSDIRATDTHVDDMCTAAMRTSVACASTGIRFENADWRLDGDGLEHRATGYFIARGSIAMRRGDFWEWPLHLAEKNWCTARSFRQAFLAALDAYGLVADASLDHSFTVAFGLMAGTRSVAAKSGTEGFTALGDLVRPKPTKRAQGRTRIPASESRAATRRAGMPMPQRMGDAARQRAAF